MSSDRPPIEPATGEISNADGVSRRGELTAIRRWLRNGTPRERVEQLVMHYPTEQRSLELSWSEIVGWDPELADRLLDHPGEYLELFEEALRTVPIPVDVSPSSANVRISGLPETVTVEPGGYSPSNPPSDLLAVTGQVAKRTQTEACLVEAAFECQRCGTMTYIPQPSWGYHEPHECQGCERQGPFRVNDDQSRYEDEQLAILESVESRASGGETADLKVIVRDDLCGHQALQDCQQVTVVGHLDRVGGGKKPEQVLVANNVESDTLDYENVDLSEYEYLFEQFRDDPDGMYEQCLRSVAPQFETGGYQRDEQLKEAVWLYLFGGSTIDVDDVGAHFRGEFHLLIPGDPGVGKSVLMQWADAVAPKSSYNDGARSSGPGLTAAITGDSLGDSEYTVTPGAIVRAHRGNCIVDELDKAPDEALEKAHTALEDQIVPVTMAGQETVLPAETALMAGLNPDDGHFDPARTVPEQLDLKSPMLSRFDLIFAVRSKEDRDRVSSVSDSMLAHWELAQRANRGDPLDEADKRDLRGPLSSDELRAIVMRGKRIDVVFASDAVRNELRDWYTEQRMALPERYTDGMEGSDGYDGPPLPLTARSLSATRRIAEASARAHLRDEITMADVETAKELVSRSLADLDIPPVYNAGVGGGSVSVDPTEITGV